MLRNTVKFNLGVPLVAGFVLVGLLLGCSHEKKIRYNSMTDEQALIGGVKACKTNGDTSLNKAGTITRKEVAFKRGKQPTNYKNCDGKTFKIGFEHVTNKAKVEIELKNDLQDASSQVRINLNNRTSCDTGMFRSKEMNKTLEIPLTLRRTDKADKFLLLASDRDNYIDYDVLECTEMSGDVCTQSHMIEQGTLIVSVRFNDYELAESKEVTVCRKPPELQVKETSLP